MHVLASLPNRLMVEIDRTGNGLVDHLLTTPIQVLEGEAVLPLGPGLGIELNPDALERFSVADRIPDGNYSDMVFGKQYFTPAAPYDEGCVRHVK
jgi:hypothetical protein